MLSAWKIQRSNPLGRIVAFCSTDGYKQKGFLVSSPTSHTTIVHVHGSFGNFYENDFLQEMGKVYLRYGINFFSTNNRGHDGITEIYRNSKLDYVGAVYERLEDSIKDIAGAVKIAKRLTPNVVLQGHSLGCVKVLHFLKTYHLNYDTILLSPSDPYQIQSNYNKTKTLDNKISKLRLKAFCERELAPKDEFGVKQRGASYYIPISYGSLLRFLTSPSIKLLHYPDALSCFFPCRLFVYYGERDPLWTITSEQLKTFFEPRCSSLTFLSIPKGDHHFHRYEKKVAENISRWISNNIAV